MIKPTDSDTSKLIRGFIDFLHSPRAGQMTVNDRRDLVEAINASTKRVRDRVKSTLHSGQRVTWVGKYGVSQAGTILKVNSVCCKIRHETTGVTWRVSISLLKPSTL